jgi:hypothetical protein
MTLTGANACTSAAFTYTIGSGCQAFSLSNPPAHIEAEYTLTAQCSITSDTALTGSASPGGPTQLICCQ